MNGLLHPTFRELWTVNRERVEMKHRHSKTSGDEPELGGHQALTGMEPALSREFIPLSGRFRIKGLEAPAVPGRRRPLVLLAERDPDAAQVIQLVGDLNGYQVKVTRDGAEAWRLLRTFIPDLLITNIRLAGMDGLELVHHVRTDEQSGLCAMPILVMDVNHYHQYIMDTFKSGADDYLEMPYDMAVMLRCWRRLLSSCRRPSPLTALQNEDMMIRQVALSDLLDRCPDGLVGGLSGYLWHPDRMLRTAARWALRRVGTDEALAALQLTTG